MTDETKEFASIEDATPTTAIPSETDATTATTTMVTVDDRTDTTVLPSAADDDETAVLPVPTIMRMRRSRMWIRRQQLPLHRPSNQPQIGLPWKQLPMPWREMVGRFHLPMMCRCTQHLQHDLPMGSLRPPANHASLGGAPRTSRMLRMSRVPRTSRNRAPARLLWYSDY